MTQEHYELYSPSINCTIYYNNFQMIKKIYEMCSAQAESLQHLKAVQSRDNKL